MSSRRIGLHFVLVPFLAAAIAACGGDSGGDTGWQPVEIGETQSLSGVWGSGPNDVFVVGGNDDRGEIHHYDGTTWSPMDLPANTSMMVWAFGFGPNDVWAAGRAGDVIHYDGTAWTEVDSKTDQDLWGVWGASSNDVYIVGGNIFSGQVTILHWDGSEIQEEELPTEANPLAVRALFKIFGIGDRVFAVGQLGLIVERTEAGWVRHSAGEVADQDFVALWGTSANDIVAVGGRTSAIVSTWDGSSWSTVAPVPNFGGLNAITVDDQGELLIGGVFGSVGTWDRVNGSIVYEDIATQIDVHAIWNDGDETSYAVGGNFAAPHEGIIFSRSSK